MRLQAAVVRSRAPRRLGKDRRPPVGGHRQFAAPSPFGRPFTTALAARLYARPASPLSIPALDRRRRDLAPRWRLALAPPAAGSGEPAVGIGGDLDELLERRLEARIAAAAQDDLLGEEEREVTQLERWAVGNRTVLGVAGVDLPAAVGDARAPGRAREVEQLG